MATTRNRMDLKQEINADKIDYYILQKGERSSNRKEKDIQEVQK